MKIYIIIIALVSLFISGCNPKSDTSAKVQTNTEEITKQENEEILVNTGEIKEIIKEYKNYQDLDPKQLQEEDIELMEKIIQAIEKN